MTKISTRKNNRLKNIFSKINNNIVGTALAAVRNSVHMELTDLGRIIDKKWRDISNRYNNIDIDKFIIMPNHIHGILVIDKREGASPSPTIPNIIGSFKSKSSVEYLKFVNQNNLNISGRIWQRSLFLKIHNKAIHYPRLIN